MKDVGYEWEALKVHTEDGFILSLFHLTGKVGEDFVERDDSLMPVLFMPGSQSDASTWVTVQTEWDIMSLRLFDEGFDVWFANNRGTRYALEHETYTVDDPEFWLWSWSEMGLYDDVANIKMIQEKTGKPKVSYIGVSQGTV